MMEQAYSARYFELLRERRNLPVWEQKEEFLQTFEENQVVMLAGETGSGKTTQIPQFVLEALVNENPKPNPRWVVGCTQPRRVAAMSVARRVAEEMDVEMGQEVGYTVRFEDCSSTRTVLKYLTDGMLLREAMADPLLERYKVIVLDEAHERSLDTDLLFGILRQTLISRPDLKLVVMSATLRTLDELHGFFSGAPLIRVPPARLHPLEVLYAREPVRDYLEAAISLVIQIDMFEPPGNILVFLTGEQEIEDACSRISRTLGDQVEVVPLHPSLPPAMLHKIFDPTPHPMRKIVVSTDIAETSLAMDGIVYVIDPGFCKLKVYNSYTRAESLLLSLISKASADQRAARAGRKCFRLYTQKHFNDMMMAFQIPEILRSNLANTVLILKRLGVVDLPFFEFIDPPTPEALLGALEDLFDLGAVDDEGNLTDIGEMLSLQV